MKIFKFGGASVKDANAVRNLQKIVNTHRSASLLVVVSAMGKTTNFLEIIADLSFKGKEYNSELKTLIEDHESICMDLFGQIPGQVSNWFIKLEESLLILGGNWYQFYDSIISYGELISTTIVQLHLQESMSTTWVDARDYVRTNSKFTEANVDWQLTEHIINKQLPEILSKSVIVTQGFIGSDLTGKPTTLGREGSDYSGAIFAYCLKAESLTVWKDVAGLLNADPKVFPNAQKFDELSFQEVSEMTYFGAKVIHPKTIRPLAQREIPLFVKSFLDSDAVGTKISNNDKQSTIPSFVFKGNQLLVTLRVLDSSFMDEKKLVKIFLAIEQANVKVNLMHSSALTFTFCFDANHTKLDTLKDSFAKDFQLLYNENLLLITIKNYNEEAFSLIPSSGEMILEQKTRHNYQVLRRL